MTDSPLSTALRHFEAVEANLVKAENVLVAIENTIPDGIAFGENPEYEKLCWSFDSLFASLPKIDGWKPKITLMDIDEIAQARLDALEVGEFETKVWVERQIVEPSRLLREYRHRYAQKRRELIRDALTERIDEIDANLRVLSRSLGHENRSNVPIADPEFEKLKSNVDQISILLGNSVPKPREWSALHRHLHFGMLVDLHDITQHDWPSVKAGLRKALYGEQEPVPVEVEDIGQLVRSNPRGSVVTKLHWDRLTSEQFERFIFALISSEKAYENPEWLMKTTAPDRGRDLSVYRIQTDPLGETIRQRVIIQCKHRLTKSIDVEEIATLREKIKAWEPPRIDILVMATSGRFTADAVAHIEKHNQSDSALRLEMWPESHLERILANKPAIIAEFSLR